MRRWGDAALLAGGRVARVPPFDDIPGGGLVELPGRGTTYLVDTGPPPRPGARPQPPIVLLHALACTGLLTWYPTLRVLRERYRVITFDQRWHGQGIMSPRFSLDDCADDAAAVAEMLGLENFLAVGYSMGSLVAQLLWRRHRDRLAGVVLCASTARFVRSREPAALRIVAEATARAAVRGAIIARPALPWQPGTDGNRWALGQFRSTTGRRVATAAAQIARFDSTSRIGAMDVPAAVVVTTRDRLLLPARQFALARAIPDAAVYEVEGGHASCVLAAQRFTPAVQAACASVAARAAALARP